MPCYDLLHGRPCRKPRECGYSHERDVLQEGWNRESKELQSSIFNPAHQSHHLLLIKPLDNGSWFPKYAASDTVQAISDPSGLYDSVIRDEYTTPRVFSRRGSST